MIGKHRDKAQHFNYCQVAAFFFTGVVLIYAANAFLAFALPMCVLTSPCFKLLSGIILQMMGSMYVGWRLRTPSVPQYVAFVVTSIVLIHVGTLLALYGSFMVNDAVWAFVECIVGGTGVFMGGRIKRSVTHVDIRHNE